MQTTLSETLQDIRVRLDEAMASTKYPEIDATLKGMAQQASMGSIDSELIAQLEHHLESLDETIHPRAVGVIRSALELVAESEAA